MLTLKQQALALWAICRYATEVNPEACPIELLENIDSCPFGSKPCQEITPSDWGDFIRTSGPDSESKGETDAN